MAFECGHYGQRRVRIEHKTEAFFKVNYEPSTNRIEIRQAAFGHLLTHLRTDFQETERNKKWRIPPLIPKSHSNMLDSPKSILADQSGIRYPDYSKKARLVYERVSRERPLHLTYQPRLNLQYQQKRFRIFEEEEADKRSDYY